MVIGGRGEAGCGIEEKIILPDLGRGMREGIGEVVKDCMSFGELAARKIKSPHVSEYRRSSSITNGVYRLLLYVSSFFDSRNSWRSTQQAVCKHPGTVSNFLHHSNQL